MTCRHVPAEVGWTYGLGAVLHHGGRYQCTACLSVVMVTDADHLYGPWCEICDDPEVLWQLIDVVPVVQELPLAKISARTWADRAETS